MSDHLEIADKLAASLLTLQGVWRSPSDLEGIYNELALADIIELEAERLRMMVEVKDCCGDGSEGLCGCCNSRLDDVAYKAKQVQQKWEEAA